ncbi:MAG: hypothetical protein ABIK72_01680 [candidate division WOR-3 bacterium]
MVSDSETDIYLNPANLFFWNKKFFFSFFSYHDYLSLDTGLPVSFQSLLSIKGNKKDFIFNISYHYLLSYRKTKEKTVFLDYLNLPISFNYNLEEIKIGLGVSYQEFYLEKSTIHQNFIEKKRYLPIKLGFSKGEEERFEWVTQFISFENSFCNYQINLIAKKVIGEIDKHIFLLDVDYRKENNLKSWEFLGGYCLSSYYNFYGFILNNFFAMKPLLFLKKEVTIKIIFPYGLIGSFGKIKFLFGLKNGLIWEKENICFTNYEYNFGLNYRFSNNFEFYFLNLLVNSSRRWFFGFKFSF